MYGIVYNVKEKMKNTWAFKKITHFCMNLIKSNAI